MYTLVDVVSISIIIVLFVFLFILFQFENGFKQPGIYLRAALILVVLLSISEELIYLKQYIFVLWSYPFYIAGFFVIYPLLYLYSHNMVYNVQGDQRSNLIKILIFPFFILLFVSLIYYPLDENSKIMFANLHLAKTYHELKVYQIFQYIVFPLFYLQTALYIILFFRLIFVIRKDTRGKPWRLLLSRYILLLVIAIISYESLYAIDAAVFSNFNLIRMIEEILSLLFVLVGVYIGLKHSLIQLQFRITKYAGESHDKPESERLFLHENEKQEIKEAIENYFNDSKIYLDPNLKLESLSKKIHITTRRISRVINEIDGYNFKQFVNEFRISEAKKLITKNPHNAKIESIYTEVGFNSRSAFNHAFKESTGASPSDYIKKLIE